jgi:hypothetical protein
MNYDTLIKRAEKAIKEAEMKDTPASVHKVTIDDDISKLSGLVVVMHPDFIKKQKASNPC